MKNNSIEFRSNYSMCVFKLENNKYEFEIHLFYNNKLVIDNLLCNSIYFDEILEIDSKNLIFSNDEANVTKMLYLTPEQYWTIKK